MNKGLKRFIVLMMITSHLITICACNKKKKSEEAQAADDLIAEIGTVDLDSEDDIIAAEDAVDSLSAEDLKSLDGYDDLKKAREEYDALVDESIVSLVEEKIDAIGEVTVDSEGVISEAQEAYDALETRLKDKVSNLSDLEDAKTALIDAKVLEIESLIGEIGEVNSESESAINKARSAYDKASPEVQERVTNTSDLTNAEEKFATLRAAEIEEAINAIGEVSLDSQAPIDTARQLYDAASQTIKDKVTNYNLLTEAEEQFKRLKDEEAERQKMLSDGDVINTSQFEVVYKRTKITNKIIPDDTSGYYWYQEANNGSTFIDVVFKVTNVDTRLANVYGLVTDCKVEYKGKTYSKDCYLFFASGNDVDPVYEYFENSIEPLSSFTVHAAIEMPEEIEKNGESIKVRFKIGGQEKVIVVR